MWIFTGFCSCKTDVGFLQRSGSVVLEFVLFHNVVICGFYAIQMFVEEDYAEILRHELTAGSGG